VGEPLEHGELVIDVAETEEEKDRTVCPPGPS